MPEGGAEYWYVIYKAIGDFGDLMKGAAEAKKSLQAMGDAVKAETAAEVAGATQAAAAWQKDIAVLKQEATALTQLGSAAKQTNVQLLYGGRNDMQAHLSDQQRLLEYQTLINRAQWLGFSTVQQAMSYRQQMYQQKLLENRAEFAGYLTADQYLGFLSREIASTTVMSAAIKARTMAVQGETQAVLGYDNAVTGAHASIGQLGEGISAYSSYAAALTGLPTQVTTRLTVDDGEALAEIAAYQSALAHVPRFESTDIVSVATRLGGVPLTARPSQAAYAALEAADAEANDALGRALAELSARESAPAAAGAVGSFRPGEGDEEAWQALVERVGTAYDALEAADAEARRVGGDFAPHPADAPAWEQLALGIGNVGQAVDTAAAAPGWDQLALDVEYFSGLVDDIPRGVVARVEFDDAQAEQDLAGWLDDLEAGQQTRFVVTDAEFSTAQGERELQDFIAEIAAATRKRYMFLAGLDDTEALEELDALQALEREVGRELELVAGGGGAAGGGGGGGPPPGAGDLPNPEDAEAWDALGKKISGAGADAHASVQDFMDLAAAAADAGDQAKFMYAAMVAGRVDASALGDDALYTARAFLDQALATGKAEDASRGAYAAALALGLAERAVSAASRDAAGGAAAAAVAVRSASGAIPPMVDGLIASTGGWYGLNSQLRVFGGLMPGVLGHVAAWHVLVDFIIEGLAVFIPAIVTLIADLGAFGLAGSDAAKEVYNRLIAIHTASDALDQTLAPMTGQLEKLHDVVRPQVWELYGDAIDIAHAKTGLFDQMAIMTGGVLDRLAAHVTVFAAGASKGLASFFAVGNQDLARLGQFFDNLGKALLALIKITQETHVDQIFLAFFVALSQLLVLITKLPTPLLAVVVGLHAFWLWGGLAATVVMQLLSPLRALALALGAVDAAEVGGGLAGLGKDASAFERLKAGLTDIGAGLGAIPGRLNIFSKAADEAGVAAEGAAAGAAATGEEAAVAAGRTGMFAGMLGTLASVPVVGWLAALGVALVGVGVYLGMRTNQTQAWIESMDTALGKVSAFKVVGQTMSDLAAVTAQLAASQRSGAGDSTELANAQADLSTKLGAELGHVGQVSHAYGVSMVGALALLNAAGVKTSDIFTKNNTVWAQALQQVRGLVDGYAAMGQGMSTIQRDVSVQLVLGSDQYKAMQTLSTAWDNFQKLVAAPQSGILKTAQDLQQFAADAKVAGASMTALNGPSLTLQTDFQGTYSDVETLFSALRASEAVTGDNGFSGAVRNAVQVLIPLAGNNKAAAAEISQLAQEAGGPATTNLKLLAKWAGNTHDPLAALYKDAQNATIGASNLDQDASRLSATLANDLNPAMANAAFSALGGQQVFNTFAADLEKFGPKAQPTIQAGRAVAQELLSVDKNSASARAQFVGWGESMGLTGAQASALWGEVSKGEKPLASIRDALGKTAASQADLAKPGTWGQVEHQFMSLWDKIRAHPIAFAVAGAFNFLPGVTTGLDKATAAVTGFFTKTVPHAAGDMVNWFTQSLPSAWDQAYQGFFRGFASPLVSWFTVSLPHAYGLVSAALSTGWGTAWNGFNRDFAGKVESWFTVSLPHAWGLVSGAVSGSWSNAYTGFQRNLAGPITHWATVLLPRSMGGQAISEAWGTAWNGFNRDFAGKVEHWFAASLPNALDLAGSAFSTTWGTVWDGFDRDVISKVGAWFSQSVPHALVLVGGAFTSTWSFVWSHFLSAVWSPLSGFFTKTVPGWLGGTGASWGSLWNTAWAKFASAIWTPFLGFFTKTVAGWFSGVARLWSSLWTSALSVFNRYLVSPADTFFTRTVPGWLDNLGGVFARTWSKAWTDFDRDLLTPMEHWFSSTLPGAVEGAFKSSVNWVINDVINKVINGINAVTGVFGVPKIGDVPSLAAGGGVRQAGGSIGGTPDMDGSHIIAMGGEYMLRQPARMALQAAYGGEFLDHLNQADSWLGSGSRGTPASQAGGTAMAGGGILPNPVSVVKGAVHAVEAGVDWAKQVASKGLVAAFNALWDSSLGKLADLAPAGTAEGSLARAGADEIKKGVDSFLGKAAAKAAADAKVTGGSGVIGGLPANWHEIASFLASHGFTEFAAAGVTGNIDAESGGNPEILEEGGGGGGGLIQWTPYPSGYITGNASADMMTQLNAILSWGGGPGTVNQATSPSNAAAIYQDDYERPASLTASLGVREGSANAVYQAMGWGSIGGGHLTNKAAGGPVITAIKEATANRELREAMALGSYLLTGWDSGYSRDKKYGAFALAPAKGVNETEAKNPSWAVRHLLGDYTAGVRRDTAGEWSAHPQTAAGDAAGYAQRTSSRGDNAAWNAVLEALGYATAKLPAPRPAAGPGALPAGTDPETAWVKYSGRLKGDADSEATAFWSLYNEAMPYGKKGQPSETQYAQWRADMQILRQQQAKAVGVTVNGAPGDVSRLLTRLSGDPASATAAQWTAYWEDLSALVSWQEGPGDAGGADPPSSTYGQESGYSYPKGYKAGSIPARGWAGWKYDYARWNALRGKLATLKSDTGLASGAWQELYGPGSTTGAGGGAGTPGVTVQLPGSAAPVSVDLSSLIPQGPSVPSLPGALGVQALDVTGLGFASGGSLSDVAGMFALGGSVPLRTPGPAQGLVPSLTQAGQAGQGTPRTVTSQAGDRIGVQVGSLTIHNPVAEKPSDSITRSSNRLAFLAGRGPV